MISLLLIVGVTLLFVVWQRSGELAVAKAVSGNAGLLCMIIGVGFLKLVALPTLDTGFRQLSGRKALRNTMLSMAVFGSFINFSAMILIADRLSLNRRLDLFSCSVLTRIFSGCSAWSPFFACMAVVLTQVPDVRLWAVILWGLPFALIGMLVTYLQSVIGNRDEVDSFEGFPMQISSLWVPASLAMLVIVIAQLVPRLSLLTVIALGCLVLTTVILLSLIHI